MPSPGKCRLQASRAVARPFLQREWASAQTADRSSAEFEPSGRKAGASACATYVFENAAFFSFSPTVCSEALATKETISRRGSHLAPYAVFCSRDLIHVQ